MRAGIFALLLGLSVVAQGNEQHSGFYFGALGGVGKFTGKTDYDTRDLEVGDNLAGYGVYVGYKVRAGNLTTALEVDYLGYDGDVKIGINASDYHLTAKWDHSYSASLLLGFMAAENVEVYLRGGYGKTHATVKAGEVTLKENDIDFEMPVAGLGFRFTNDTSLGLRFEYRHHFNKDYKMPDDTDFESSNNLFLVSLDYLF